ncbi:unnamed protein product [Rhizoctonia solani]|uniref:Uncharacterized protein n=1 Tax=Rhizoctonia solani TaxID=456999 RepID=A0A8H2WWG6_9AGAM|nr:unnamed protein product [Rhizoctonia solani]
MTSQQPPWSPDLSTHYQQPNTDQQGVGNYLASQQQAGYSQPQQAGYANQQQPGYNPQQPNSGYTQPGQGYTPNPNPNTQTYTPNPNAQTYAPNSAYPQPSSRPPLPAPPPHGANRQMSLPLGPSHGYNTHGQHAAQPADTSVAALDLAQYSARLNAQQAGYNPYPQAGYGSNVQPAYGQPAYSAHPQPAYASQPQSGYATPPGGYAYGAQVQPGYASQTPAAAYPTQPTAANYQSPTTAHPSMTYPTPPASQPVSSNYNPEPTVGGGTVNVADFIDVGPFTYAGIRSPPPKRDESPQRPQRQESPQRPQRHESPQRVQRQESPQRVQRHESPQKAPRNESPQRPQTQSPHPTGHLPWAPGNTSANGHDLGDPDLVYPASTPSRNNSNSAFNVQARSQNPAHDSASEASHSPEERNANETSYFSPDPSTENKGKKDWGVREEGERAGDINSDGKLISNGPRIRMAVRALEVLCAIGAVVACIYAFAVPKPNPAAPPASRPAVYLIVVFGFVTIIVFAYIYIIRGLFGVGRSKDDPYAHAMVLPISRHRLGGSNKSSKSQSNVQVNLIVDPSATEQGSNLTPGVPWSKQKTSGGVFTSYEREKARLAARKGLWWALGLDVVGALAWGAGFVLAMVGPRCPVGGYSGWCNAFNGAVACSCIGCVLFIVSGVLVGRDLVASRRSDRKLGKGY